MKEDWMWRFVCDEWHKNNNATACSRDANNMVTLTAYVENTHIELSKNCLFFMVHHAQYEDKRKRLLVADHFGENFHSEFRVFSVTKYNNESAMDVVCPKKALDGHYFKMNCQARANDTDVMDVIADNSIHDDRILSFSQFWFFFLALAISWIGMSVVVSVGDAICFDLLGKRHELYGNQRLWGAVGWGLFSIIAGILVDGLSGYKYFKNYSVIYIMMAAALLPDMLVSSCLEVCAESMANATNRPFNFVESDFAVQTKRNIIEYHQRCEQTVQIASNHRVLHLVHRDWILHGLGVEFLILASRRSGR